jgi:hypothetical protein
MRRIVTSLAVLGALAVSACSGGGSVLSFDNSSTPDRVILTVVGPTNIARVLPGAGLPISATAVRGSQNGVVPTNRFRWSAALSVGGQYSSNSLGVLKDCGSVTMTAGGSTVPYTADFSSFIAIDPTNGANIVFTPPTTIPPPAGATLALPAAAPYCVIVSATPIGGSAGNTGSITVAVVNPLNPLQ